MPWPARCGEGEKLELPALGVEPALQAGRRGDEEGGGAGVPAAHEGEVAGVVARVDLLLVGAVLLLVHHDQAEVGDRGEEGRAGAEHHPRLAAAHPLPLLVALARAQSRSAGWPARSPNQRSTVRASAGTSAISGTSRMAERPRARASSAARR